MGESLYQSGARGASQRGGNFGPNAAPQRSLLFPSKQQRTDAKPFGLRRQVMPVHGQAIKETFGDMLDQRFFSEEKLGQIGVLQSLYVDLIPELAITRKLGQTKKGAYEFGQRLPKLQEDLDEIVGRGPIDVVLGFATLVRKDHAMGLKIHSDELYAERERLRNRFANAGVPKMRERAPQLYLPVIDLGCSISKQEERAAKDWLTAEFPVCQVSLLDIEYYGEATSQDQVS